MEGVQVFTVLLIKLSPLEAVRWDILDFVYIDRVHWELALVQHVEEVNQLVFSSLLVRQFFSQVINLSFFLLLLLLS